MAESLHAVQKIQGARSSAKVYHPTNISTITAACTSLSSSHESTADQVAFNQVMTTHRKGQKQANSVEPTGSRSDRGSAFHKWYSTCGMVWLGWVCVWILNREFTTCILFSVLMYYKYMGKMPQSNNNGKAKIMAVFFVVVGML